MSIASTDDRDGVSAVDSDGEPLDYDYDAQDDDFGDLDIPSAIQWRMDASEGLPTDLEDRLMPWHAA